MGNSFLLITSHGGPRHFTTFLMCYSVNAGCLTASAVGLHLNSIRVTCLFVSTKSVGTVLHLRRLGWTTLPLMSVPFSRANMIKMTKACYTFLSLRYFYTGIGYSHQLFNFNSKENQWMFQITMFLITYSSIFEFSNFVLLTKNVFLFLLFLVSEILRFLHVVS